jgi:hypothetical protein
MNFFRPLQMSTDQSASVQDFPQARTVNCCQQVNALILWSQGSKSLPRALELIPFGDEIKDLGSDLEGVCPDHHTQ